MDIEEEVRLLRATVQHMKDRQDILDCIVREARGRDRHDEAIIRSCYWDDGADEHGPMICPADEYPARANAGHAAFFGANCHNITNHTCEIEDNVASCETYVVGGLLSTDEKTCKIAPGRYLDRLEKRPNKEGVAEWRIVVRRTVVDMVDMVVEGDATWLASPALTGFLRGSRGHDDVSYQRPIRFDGSGPKWQQ